MEDNEKILDSILVALDGSRPSQTAASLAIQIAQRENLLIQGLYVVDDVLVLDPYSSLEKELDIQQRDLSSDERANLLENQGDTVLRWLEDRCQTAGVPVKTELRLGQLHDIINSRAESPRLLAMGRRGRSYDQDTASLGHNFREIAHHPPAPMLIGGDELPLIQRMLLAYDGSMQAKHALFWAGSLQRVWQSHLLALSVADENASSRWLQEMEEQVDESGLEEYRFIGRQGDPATQILQTIIDENVDLVIMGGHQHGALLEWFTGSTLDQVLRSTQVPLFMTAQQ
jgi:nucleotide-binding universal stress UspA family protein